MTWLQTCASGSTFSAALPHGDAVPVLALSVPSSACGRCSLCGSCCLEIPPFCSKICRAYPLCKGRLAQPVERKALNLNIGDSNLPWVCTDFSANEALVPILRLLSLPHRKVFLFSLSLSPFQAVPMLSLSCGLLVVVAFSVWRLLY